MTIKYYDDGRPVYIKQEVFFPHAKCLLVSQIRSSICLTHKQRAHLRALGLGKINSSAILPNNAAIRGKIFRLRHVVKVVATG